MLINQAKRIMESINKSSQYQSYFSNGELIVENEFYIMHILDKRILIESKIITFGEKEKGIIKEVYNGRSGN